ncbi:NAP1-related protein 2-like [Trifolium medium]|uniref:NAP1-related protein 2-like n=1 Tax=Trifolium medium TaxID=97028 RepID=A0A392LZ90_9FABA|nr:NAP1-related protein 2-like [Trifolium medium]
MYNNMDNLFEKRKQIIENIPNFWKTVFMNHEVLRKCLNQRDQEVFDPNEYFDGTILQKSFIYDEDDNLACTEATKISWKHDMEIEHGVDPDAEQNDVSHSHWSFFKWFHSTAEDVKRVNEDMVAFVIRDEIHPNPLTVFGFKGMRAGRSVIEELDLDDVEPKSRVCNVVHSRKRKRE